MQGLLRRLGLSSSIDKGGGEPSATTRVAFTMHNCDFLTGFAPTPELKASFKSAHEMLRGRVHQNWGMEVGSDEYREMWQMTHWVSSDPAMAEKIHHAVKVTREISGMTAEIELTRREIQDLIKAVDGKYFPNEELPVLQKALQ